LINFVRKVIHQIIGEQKETNGDEALRIKMVGDDRGDSGELFENLTMNHTR